MNRTNRWFIAPLALLMAAGLVSPATVRAGGPQTLKPVTVTDAADNLVGTADSSTEGTITPALIEDRPILRTGELLEWIPGMLISQHSGEGKANQYYLRGINLDHGTDFATTVDDMPVNMPTHAHGQGYTDLNFIIPELLSGVQYHKGPYYAEEGDFSAVGAAHMDYVHDLAHSIGTLTFGNDSYQRGFAATSFDVGKEGASLGKFLLGAELMHDNGPWVNPDNYQKINAMMRYTRVFGRDMLTVDAMAYYGLWNATNQTADRAIAEGLVPYYGTLDPTDRGSSYRYSLSAQWQHIGQSSVTQVSVYGISYGMDLFNDFTYFLENPGYGDQFHQMDRRFIIGAKASHNWFNKVFGRDMDTTIGLQSRNDIITPVALYSVDQTQYKQTEVQDDVTQINLALYAQNRFQWAKKFRTVLGLRWDFYYWIVNANVPQNSANLFADMPSPKLSMIFGPWKKTEFFLNGGLGFHSNDVRSATEKVDPQYNLPQTPVKPLERAVGAEVGLRTAIVPHLQNELTVWYMYLASEQIFDGDHGVTTPSFPSNRYGVESANYYTPFKWLTIDADLAFSVPRFIGDPAGCCIPGSPTWVFAAGATLDNIRGFFASLRMHYFGSRPQIDNDVVVSNSSTILNARVGYQSSFKYLRNWRLWVDVFNVLNSQTTDIDYYYVSRLPGEPPAGVNDIHTHPADDIQVRVNLKAVF